MIYPQNFEQKIGFDRVREWLFQKCLSTLGRSKVDEMQFHTNHEILVELLQQVSDFKDICLNRDDFPADFFIDVRSSLKRAKIEGIYLEVEEIFDLQRSLEAIRSILRYLEGDQGKAYASLRKMASGVTFYPFVLEAIERILNKRGKIKDNASSELSSIRRSILTKQGAASKQLNQILKEARDQGWAESDATPAMRDGRLVIPVPAAHKRRIKGFIHDESATGKTSFIEPIAVVELNNEIRELEFDEHREIIRILSDFTKQLRPYIEDLLEAYQFLAKVDFIRAKALMAIELDALMPIVNPDPGMTWVDARHPILYHNFKTEGKKVVPLSLQLDVKKRIMVISGPNAGGKSVCLTTAGLLQYMLQCGLLVPVSEASKFGMFENIFIDIGDEQSIENDLSTYSSHLLNMKFFIRNADSQTLILIDEFGTGTEPMMGGAIAESILEKLNQQLVFGVITTHYTNLKHFATSAEGIMNAAMLYDSNRLQPLFILDAGNPGSSFAFEIARKTGLPEDVLQSAKDKIGKDHIDFDRHLRELVRDKRYWEQKREKIHDLEKRLEELISKQLKELEEARKFRNEATQKARQEAQQLLSSVNKKIENTISEIREAQADKEKTREIRKDFQIFKQEVEVLNSEEARKIDETIERLKQKQQIQSQRKKNKPVSEPQLEIADPDVIETGDKVKLHGQETVGEIIEINGDKLLIAFGNMLTTVKKERVEKISNRDFKKILREAGVAPSTMAVDMSKKRMGFRINIDVRGMRSDEAIRNVEEFIDEAIMFNIGEVKILHGKGDGILRVQIRNFLQRYKEVRSVQDEHVEFGGAGITVVNLKM